MKRLCKLLCFVLIFSVFCLLSARQAVFAQEDDILSHAYFFGDSTTAHLACRGGIPEERVWSGAGNTVLFETVNRTKCVHLEEENLDLTLADAVAQKKPEILVITLGVSGGAGFIVQGSVCFCFPGNAHFRTTGGSPENKIDRSCPVDPAAVRQIGESISKS